MAVDGTPLVGVNVSFLHHSDYGFTISRQDGRYVSIASDYCGGQIQTARLSQTRTQMIHCCKPIFLLALS